MCADVIRCYCITNTGQGGVRRDQEIIFCSWFLDERQCYEYGGPPQSRGREAASYSITAELAIERRASKFTKGTFTLSSKKDVRTYDLSSIMYGSILLALLILIKSRIDW